MSIQYTFTLTGLGNLPRPFPGPGSTMYPQASNSPKSPSNTPSPRLGRKLHHDHFQVQDLLWIPRHITTQHTLIPTIHLYQHTLISTIIHTLISTIHLYQHTLISTIVHTYINNNPYSATPHNNHFPFLFRVQHPTASI